MECKNTCLFRSVNPAHTGEDEKFPRKITGNSSDGLQYDFLFENVSCF